ncbi:prephenate dehydrogenase [Bifidobacterium sp. UTCIF-37]|uniref:prephenate dehydrogenase n=1 Tax=unclassified Bifidobacterium TaxID=2608897 RepID=UPI00112D4E96|nr:MULTISPECIES: prephenate dehydrogenase/arogenate dehydrogenase family protein [unclassified Bifidobacterium]TPF87333.1 prephenate dehydrogenase [Bifidobacterium sp. UTCIF-37]TPF91571.1 prephenate dehydrogenase [Bifidobacterium sp. UTCIF-38]
MTIGIVGMGLIGGSLARRLVDRGVKVIAWNHRPHPYAEAERAGIRCVPTLAALVEAGPDVIVLCNPLKAMPAILAELKPLLDAAPDITLTDVGSVKGMVRDQVEAAGLGERYVGAHPMAGNELSGWTAADPALYDDALWAITVTPDTDFNRFLAVARLIVDGVGNRVIVLDDDTHDKAAAMISHMPHVVATALINELTADPNRNIAAALAAGSWRDMTRVALTDPDRTRAMVEEDAANVEGLLRDMAARLNAVADLLHVERTAAVPSGAADPHVAAMKAFFAEGQPFRDYKARQRAIAARGEGTEDASGELAYEERLVDFAPEHWQEDLLDSARRGEHIIALVGSHTVRVQLRSAL